MNGRSDYAERRDARVARLRARADKRAAEGQARLDAAHRTASIIPMGQPILVGHHSEKKHRRDLARIDSNTRKGIEAVNAAKALERRADVAEENRAISSDDPSALERLREKLGELEASHALMVKGNAAIRAAKTDEDAARALLALGFDVRAASSALTYLGSKPYGFNLSNSSAGIRSVKARIAELAARAAVSPAAPERLGEITIEESENRVRVVFPGKPSDDLRARLKSRGFRWSPSSGAWQRHASAQAWHEARLIAELAQSTEAA